MAKTVKPTVKKRSLNAGPRTKTTGAPASHKDAKHRLGNFETAGEHARVGGREGIAGQRKGKFRTDGRKK